MGKRKIDEETACTDLESTAPDNCGREHSKHRSCWVHIAASLHSRKKKIPKREIEMFKMNSPCFWNTFPHRERSTRRVKCKSATTKVEKKLTSEAFEDYLQNIWRSLSEDKRTLFTYLDSLWFNMYRQDSYKEKVLTWIKKKCIFSKEYVLVPIVCWSHWCLLIFCHFGERIQSKTRSPCMLLLDSLEIANPRRFEPEIRKFVVDIFRVEGRPETKELIYKIPFLVPKVPQQRDNEECGNFVLYFCNLFIEGAPKNFSIRGYPYFMKENWFTQEGLTNFCEKLNSTEKCQS